MNFTMKILAMSVLLVAMMALALGTEAPPEAEAAPATEAPVHKKDEGKTESKDEDGEEAQSTDGEKKHEVAKRSLCRCGWSQYGRSCYRYFATSRTWAQAQKHCQALGGNLASVHNRYEDYRVRSWARGRLAWIGFSDAQQERYWFWIDGTRFNFQNWCSGQPNNYRRRQHCTRTNYTGRKCWDDYYCSARQPYICMQRR